MTDRPTPSPEAVARKLTDTQRKALVWVCDAHGGAIDRYGKVVCCGERGPGGRVLAPETFLRLVAFELLRGEAGRIVPTDRGYSVATNAAHLRGAGE